MTETTVVIMLCDVYLSWVVLVGPKVGHAGTSSDMWVLPKGQHIEKTTAKSPGTSLCSDLHLVAMALGPQQLSRSRPALLCFTEEPQAQKGFPGGTSGKDPSASAGDMRDAGLIPGLGRSPGGGHGSPLQYFCLGSPMDRGAWWATVHGVAESDTTDTTNTHTHTRTHLLNCP